ncbi:hypothetical protein GOP47_0021611 [Adiantum capillus-veneris]|uniref:Fungal lipase-type domain-containing protein n=1 Tax=Adiantum capillus-veneris TaxID=13818 RepID=A0A9D4U7R4_ADICA|nr:hypothetical protein GOP47_0021611 [Adiantum capillus-veneris]
MDYLSCRIGFGCIGVWVPASTGKLSEDGSPLAQAPRRSAQICACRSPPSQFKTATATNSASSTEELTSKDVTSTSSFNPLPLIFPHSTIPAPLKFLWINKKGEQASESEDDADVSHTDKSEGGDQIEVEGSLSQSEVLLAKQETPDGAHGLMEPINETGVDIGESRELCETAAAPSGSLKSNNMGPSPQPLRYWMSKIAALWPDPMYFRTRSAPTDLPLPNESIGVPLEASNNGVEEACSTSQFCEGDNGEVACSLNADHNCSVEVPYTRVLHTKDSFSKFLQEASLYDMKVFTQLTFLCDMAYMIPSIQPGQLMKYHHLRLVTTSLCKKAEAEIKVKESELSKKLNTSDTEKANLNIGNGYVNSQTEHTSHMSGPQPEGCFEQPSRMHLGSVGRYSTAEPDAQCLLEQNGASSISHNIPLENHSSSILRQSEESVLQAMDLATVATLAEEKTNVNYAKDVPSLRTCPCEWFVCDEENSHTRLFVIQGSESLASWQANLFFEPIQFEGLDVYVHHGIYEAAKALYDQVLPEVIDHLSTHGNLARTRFTGHSLGGSLATLLALMLQVRGVLPSTAILPVVTFGSPFIMCGGDNLLQKMRLPKNHVQAVIMHRDVVPRAFACDYPDHVAEVLRRLNGRFREHPCLNNQKLLYSPMGQIYILQPEASAAPFHPLLPDGHGLYTLKYPLNGNELEKATELRAAQRAFLNLPHPLDILGDPGAYGFDGTVSRDHDPRSYTKAIHLVSKLKVKRLRHAQRERRRQLMWPSVIAGHPVYSKGAASGANVDSTVSNGALSSAVSQATFVFKQHLRHTGTMHFGLAVRGRSFWLSHKSVLGRNARVIASQHVQLGMLLVLSLRMVILECLSSLPVCV